MNLKGFNKNSENKTLAMNLSHDSVNVSENQITVCSDNIYVAYVCTNNTFTIVACVQYSLAGALDAAVCVKCVCHCACLCDVNQSGTSILLCFSLFCKRNKFFICTESIYSN